MAKEDLEEHFVGRVAQKAIIFRNDTVLAVRNPGVERWSLPGGRLHKNESPADGLKREVREEIGADIEIGEAVCVELFGVADMPHVSIGFCAVFTEPEAVLTLAEDEIAEMAWVPFTDIEKFPFYDDCRNMVRRALVK